VSGASVSVAINVPAIKRHTSQVNHKGKGSLHSITERRVPELITVLGSQPQVA